MKIRTVSWIIFLCCAFCGTEAALRTFLVEELCHSGWSNAYVDLSHYRTGTLSSVSSEPDFDECTIRLKPERGAGVVLSVHRFSLGHEDKLIIEDSQKFKVALIGEGDFPDERKYFASDGLLTLRYSRKGDNETLESGTKLRFQLVFTQTHEGPCRSGEFTCRNKRCISDKWLCDRHNHCGDNSDQEDCGPRQELEFETKTTKSEITVVNKSSFVMISIIICSAIVFIIVVVFIVVLIKGAVKRNKAAKARPVTDATAPPLPSAFDRIRQSFRRNNPQHPSASSSPAGTEEPKPKTYQVPSMYPQIPSAPQLTGVDNPEFKEDV